LCLLCIVLCPVVCVLTAPLVAAPPASLQARTTVKRLAAEYSTKQHALLAQLLGASAQLQVTPASEGAHHTDSHEGGQAEAHQGPAGNLHSSSNGPVDGSRGSTGRPMGGGEDGGVARASVASMGEQGDGAGAGPAFDPDALQHFLGHLSNFDRAMNDPLVASGVLAGGLVCQHLFLCFALGDVL